MPPRLKPMEEAKSRDGTVALTYPMLTKSNYTAWSMKMRAFMQAHGIWEAIEPIDPKSKVDEKKDKVALAAIYQAIPEDVLLSVADKKAAKEAWEAIKTMRLGAERARQARVQTLKIEFETMKMTEAESIEDFSLKLSGLVTNMRALGETVQENYVVKKLLRAVPARFLQITSAMEQFGKVDEMSLEEAVGSLKVHDEKVNGQEEKATGQLLLTEEEWVKREGAENSRLLLTREEWLKKSNRGAAESSQAWRNKNIGGGQGGRGGRDKSRVRCFNCLGYGHYAVDCRKSKKEKDTKPEANLALVQDEEPALLFTEASENKDQKLLLNEGDVMPRLTDSINNKIESNVWYLDNGASNHMTGERKKFKELD